ncbi:hypothetical protein CPC08DRAFT_731362 [Agrocybe pediades]|nr:hypothetical protein CPC08DRAFT_731362 [Agrocybe pediades]
MQRKIKEMSYYKRREVMLLEPESNRVQENTHVSGQKLSKETRKRAGSRKRISVEMRCWVSIWVKGDWQGIVTKEEERARSALNLKRSLKRLMRQLTKIQDFEPPSFSLLPLSCLPSQAFARILLPYMPTVESNGTPRARATMDIDDDGVVNAKLLAGHKALPSAVGCTAPVCGLVNPFPSPQPSTIATEDDELGQAQRQNSQTWNRRWDS